jgi:hypothetical protein
LLVWKHKPILALRKRWHFAVSSYVTLFSMETKLFIEGLRWTIAKAAVIIFN